MSIKKKNVLFRTMSLQNIVKNNLNKKKNVNKKKECLSNIVALFHH
jgi:hypothetical protein